MTKQSRNFYYSDDLPVTMNEEQSRKRVEEILKHIEHVYGRVPPVSEILSRRSDMFIPYSDLSKSIMYAPRFLDHKTLELAAVAASSALASEHCLNVHIEQASKFGATKEEIFEALMLGSLMAMTKAQSVALRKFKDYEQLMDKNDSGR